MEKDERCIPNKIKMLVTIIDRGKGEKLAEMFREENIVYNLIALGKGTAKSDILDYLGLGQTEKDIVLSVVQVQDVPKIMDKLKEKMQLKKPGNGIAFTIPINSVDSALALEIISSMKDDRKE